MSARLDLLRAAEAAKRAIDLELDAALGHANRERDPPAPPTLDAAREAFWQAVKAFDAAAVAAAKSRAEGGRDA